MKHKIFSKNWTRKLIFIFILLIACPFVNIVSGSENLNDFGFWGITFVPGLMVAFTYLIISSVSWLFLRNKFRATLVLDVVVFVVLLAALFLPVTNLYSMLSRHNDEIDERIRASIHILNKKILESIRNNEPSVMYDLFVEEIKSQGIDNVENLYSQFSPAIEGKKFELYNDYYVVTQNWWPVSFIVLSETIQDSEFHMGITTAKHNTYISLLKTEGDFKDLIFTFVYVKVNSKWRLHIAHLGIFRIGGRTVPEWFQEAKELSGRGYDIPALLRLSVIQQFLRIAPFVQYAKEKEIIALSNESQVRINKKHKFPIQLSSIKNAPEIYYIEPQFVQIDLLPMIKYVTKISLDNTSELQKEADAMTDVLESIFPGITKEVSHIAFKAFSEPPTDPKKTYQCYGLTVDLKQSTMK